MKKLIGVLILSIAFFSIIGCDPIKDATNKYNFLPISTGDCPVCPECPQYPKVTILKMVCPPPPEPTVNALANLVEFVICPVQSCLTCQDFEVYKIELNDTDPAIFLVTIPVFKWEGEPDFLRGHLGILVSQLEIGQRYKYWPLGSSFCLFKINEAGDGLEEWFFEKKEVE